MKVSDLVSGAYKKGVVDFGLTDHVHTPLNLPELAASRGEYLASDSGPRFHFGVEVSCMAKQELDAIAAGRCTDAVYGVKSLRTPDGDLAIGMTKRDMETYGVEYVIGGTHWPMGVPMERDPVIRDYHRQNMFLATHPLVDIVAHPWWWMGYWQDADGMYRTGPWLDDFGAIPKSMHNEFAAASVECGSVVEINISAILLNPYYPGRFVSQYLEYLAELASRGVRLCIGSDCHTDHYNINFHRTGKMLESAGIAGGFWGLPPGTGNTPHPVVDGSEPD